MNTSKKFAAAQARRNYFLFLSSASRATARPLHSKFASYAYVLTTTAIQCTVFNFMDVQRHAIQNPWAHVLLCRSDSAVFISIDFRVQEIWSHKITNAYRTMKNALIQGLTAPNVMKMLEHVL